MTTRPGFGAPRVRPSIDEVCPEDCTVRYLIRARQQFFMCINLKNKCLPSPSHKASMCGAPYCIPKRLSRPHRRRWDGKTGKLWYYKTLSSTAGKNNSRVSVTAFFEAHSRREGEAKARKRTASAPDGANRPNHTSVPTPGP